MTTIGIDKKVVQAGEALRSFVIKATVGNILTETDSRNISRRYYEVRIAPEAFRQFESARLSRTIKIVSASRTLGRVAQLENPFLRWLRNAIIRVTPEKVAESK